VRRHRGGRIRRGGRLSVYMFKKREKGVEIKLVLDSEKARAGPGS